MPGSTGIEQKLFNNLFAGEESMTSTRQRNFTRILFILTGAAILAWLVGCALFYAVVRPLIAAAYDQRVPIQALNNIIQGQDVHPLAHYVSYAHGLFRRASLSLAGFLIALWSLASLVLLPAPKMKRLLIIGALTIAVLYTTDRMLGRLFHVPQDKGTSYSERVIRLKKFDPDMDRYYRPDCSYLAKTDGLTPDDFRLRTDHRGFIGPTDRHPNPHLRIFFVGGSTTECLYVHETNRFPIASALLLEEKTGLRVNAYNAGVSGNNSLHSLNIILNDILPENPHMIVLMHNINDLIVLLYTGTYWNDNFNRSPIKRITLPLRPPPSFRCAASEIVRWMLPHTYRKNELSLSPPPSDVDEWKDIRGQTLSVNASHIRHEFVANLKTFVALCRCRGILPILMTQQNRYTPVPDDYVAREMRDMERDFGIGYAEWYKLYAMMNETIRSVATEEDVPLIDLDRLIPKSREYIYDTCHLNDRGSLFAAQLIAEALRRMQAVRQIASKRSESGSRGCFSPSPPTYHADPQ